jgi:hypothetical protein
MYLHVRKELLVLLVFSILRCEYIGKTEENKIFHKEDFQEF